MVYHLYLAKRFVEKIIFIFLIFLWKYAIFQICFHIFWSETKRLDKLYRILWRFLNVSSTSLEATDRCQKYCNIFIIRYINIYHLLLFTLGNTIDEHLKYFFIKLNFLIIFISFSCLPRCHRAHSEKILKCYWIWRWNWGCWTWKMLLSPMFHLQSRKNPIITTSSTEIKSGKIYFSFCSFDWENSFSYLLFWGIKLRAFLVFQNISLNF